MTESISIQHPYKLEQRSMITHEEIWLERALEHEQRTMQRETLLKKLWKLQQSRADFRVQMTTPTDEPNGRSFYTIRSSHRAVTSPAVTNDEAAALKA